MGRLYWSDAAAQVKLYQGDCLEELDWPDADVLVTDPPYGRGWRQGGLSGARRPGGKPGQASDARAGIQGDKDTTMRDEVLFRWFARAVRPAVVFGDLMMPPPAGTKIVLVYHKPPGSGARGAIGGFRRDAEAIYLLGPWKSALGGDSSVLTSGARGIGGAYGLAARSGHPHAKPIDILENLIGRTTGWVADPFAGSGSTLVAARNLGRPCVGVELDEQWLPEAVKRLDQGVMFFPESSQPEVADPEPQDVGLPYDADTYPLW